jgi:hypothetical protein
LYFHTDPEVLAKKYGLPIDVQEVPLSKITPVRARPEGIANAKPHMAKAGLGEGGKRDPITLVKQPDGSFKVFDGNSTFAIAKEQGWGKIPAMVVDDEDTAKAIEAKAKEAKAAAKATPKPPKSPGAVRPHHGPTADEISKLNGLKERQMALYGEARVKSYG